MSRREGLEFEAEIFSDTCSLAELVQVMIGVSTQIRVLRDPTRGGVATSLNEIAAASCCGIVIDQASLPLDPLVASACEFLGLDPLLVANEGKLIAVVAAEDAPILLDRMRQHPAGRQAAIIGQVVEDRHQLVVVRTAVGTHRVVTMPLGEQLPRIC
jgi:hydrogenase expression/formation protein HypE